MVAFPIRRRASPPFRDGSSSPFLLLNHHEGLLFLISAWLRCCSPLPSPDPLYPSSLSQFSLQPRAPRRRQHSACPSASATILNSVESGSGFVHCHQHSPVDNRRRVSVVVCRLVKRAFAVNFILVLHDGGYPISSLPIGQLHLNSTAVIQSRPARPTRLHHAGTLAEYI